MSNKRYIDICGFQVVRVPDKNRDPEGRGVWSAEVPKFGKIAYGGLDRMPWFDVHEDYYEGTLPDDIDLLRKKLMSDSTLVDGMHLCDRLDDALQLLRFSNREGDANEIIALFSEGLAISRGSQRVNAASLCFLGYDFLVPGEWSLLRDGLFLDPSHFEMWHSYVNSDGLFSSKEILSDYAQRYHSLSEAGHVEPSPEIPHRVEAVEVYRLI